MILFVRLPTAQKMKFSLRISSVNVTKSAGNLVTSTEEMFNAKLNFLCSVHQNKIIGG